VRRRPQADRIPGRVPAGRCVIYGTFGDGGPFRKVLPPVADERAVSVRLGLVLVSPTAWLHWLTATGCGRHFGRPTAESPVNVFWKRVHQSELGG
jgi:hypothetical protein